MDLGYVIMGLIALILLFISKGPFLSKSFFIVMAFVPVINSLKNGTYRRICVLIACSMLILGYCYNTGII